MNRPIRSDWTAWVGEQCSSIANEGRWRSTKVFDALGPSGVLLDNHDRARSVVSFASNDYLGLSHHPVVIGAAHAALDRWGTGAGASRLVVGTRPIHRELESALAAWKRCEAAVLFPTGYAANLGVLTTFGGPGVRIFSDELNHASIIDGCRLSGADVRIYRHRDLEHLEALLVAGRREGSARTIVISDSVFSMDGDIAPIGDLVDCSARHGSLLIVDEAHGVLEPTPTAEARNDVPLLRMGTLSKTLGSLGGFIAGPQSWIDLLVNRARSFIFTTASTPADTAAALAALGIVTSAEGDRLRERLRHHVRRVRPRHPSPIIPVILGSEHDALAASDRLLDAGLWVPAIRPPTVPTGASRLRIALSASHQDHEIDALIAALATLDAEGRRHDR
ncbi:MAG: 8-amino-7-oxononanoate synthase [Actinobacteria bacterium]|nr:8-amino-7-oxononanoate synthase [Actinomycetota bacterium]